MEKFHTLLIDNHPLLLEGLRSILSPYPDIQIIGMTKSSDEALPFAKEHKPQLVIMEIDIANGLNCVKRLKKILPDVKIIIYTSHSDQRHLPNLIQLGIAGHVVKSDPTSTLLEAIQKVRKGQVFLSGHDPGGYLIGLMRERVAKPHNEDLSTLSNRESEIFLLLAQGMPIRYIAQKLHLSPKTIESHKYNLFHKLHINSLSELIKIALRHGLIQL